MKTNLSRIGLMSLALLTSLTAVGQVTGAKKNLEIPRAANRSAKGDLGISEKKSATDDKSLSLKSDSNKGATEKSLDARSADKSQMPADEKALGGVNAGGGSFATVDGQVVLSDTYYKKLGKAQTFEKAFPVELRNYVWTMLRILPSYGIPTQNFYYSTISESNNVYILLPKAEFAQVQCDHYLPQLNRPVTNHVQFGCTKARTTYLSVEDFAAAPILEQARAIIHERLWTMAPNVDQRYIADFTTILSRLKAKQDDQIFRQDRSLLTDEEMEMFDDLELVAQQLGFPIKSFLSWTVDGKDYLKTVSEAGPLSGLITRKGGGVIWKKKSPVSVDENSFLGIGTTLLGSEETRIENSVLIAGWIKSGTIRNSTLLNSSLEADVEIENSELKSSSLEQAKVRFATISDSNVEVVTMLGTQEQPIIIRNSIVRGGDHCTGGFLQCKLARNKVGPGTQIEKSLFRDIRDIGSNVKLFKFDFHNKYFVGEFEIASNSIIQNLTLNFDPQSSWSGFRNNPEGKIDTNGQVLDFGGKECRTKAWHVEIHNAEDLLKECK